MIVTDITDQLDPPYPDRFKSEADELGLARSGGLHLTPIIRDIEHTMKPRDEWCTEDELAFFGAGGFLWERVFGEAHRDSVVSGDLVRPGEWSLDGITGSPDLIRQSDWCLIETKCTWKGLRQWEPLTLERNFWLWVAQVKSYAKMIGTNTAEIHVFFVAGNWRPPVPTVRSLRLKFSDQELDNNWKMIVNHAKNRGWL